MRRIVLKYGLIAGAILSATMLAMTQAGGEDFDRWTFFSYTSMVVAFLMVFFGVRTYRDEIAGGTIGFARALLVGLAITAIGSACYVATWQVVYFKLSTGFVEKYTAYTIEKERAAGATEDALAAKRQEMLAFKEIYDNPLFNSAVTFLEPLPVGLLMSLISAAALRRQRHDHGVVEART
jgi:hypothetical protein